MNVFFLKVVISFVVGFIWITTTSVFAEKLGSRLGGLIAGIPATMVVALFFMGLFQGVPFVVASTNNIPLVVALNSLFVVAFIFFSKKYKSLTSLGYAICFWFLLLYSTLRITIQSFPVLVGVSFLIVGLSAFLLENWFSIPIHGSKKIIYTTRDIFMRGLLGGGTIALALSLSRVFGPTIGGVFASFPALTVAMIIIISKTQTKEFLHSLLKNFIISGTINVILFVIAIRFTYPLLGIYIGTCIAMFISCVYTYAVYFYITSRTKKPQ